MAGAYEEAHGELEDKNTPGQCWLELKSQELEDGKIKAEPLKQMISAEETQEDTTPALKLKPDASLGWSKSSITEAAPPVTAEQLRRRFKLVARLWEMVRRQSPERPLLRKYAQAVWLAHADWVLGDDVMRAEIALTADGRKYKPYWSICLHLEHEVPKEAAKKMNEGRSLVDALKEAREARGLYNKCFRDACFNGGQCSRSTCRKREADTFGSAVNGRIVAITDFSRWRRGQQRRRQRHR